MSTALQEERQCRSCGTHYLSRRKNDYFCTQACRSRYNRDSHTAKCAECGRPARAKQLCTAHYKANRRAVGAEGTYPPAWDDARRDQWHRRRALLNQVATGAPVLLADLATRDEFNCGICLLPVDMTIKWPDRDSPSIDHVLPLALGGIHDPSNCQLAHLGCNSGKRDRVAGVPFAPTA